MTSKFRSQRSRRSSGTPELPEVFADRSLGRYAVPDGLRQAGFVVYTLADVYTEKVGERKADVDWIPEIASLGLPILSKDNGLRSDPERQAIIDSAARVFLLPDTQRPAAVQIERFVYHRYRIALRCRHSGPYIYRLFPKKMERFPLG